MKEVLGFTDFAQLFDSHFWLKPHVCLRSIFNRRPDQLRIVPFALVGNAVAEVSSIDGAELFGIGFRFPAADFKRTVDSFGHF